MQTNILEIQTTTAVVTRSLPFRVYCVAYIPRLSTPRTMETPWRELRPACLFRYLSTVVFVPCSTKGENEQGIHDKGRNYEAKIKRNTKQEERDYRLNPSRLPKLFLFTDHSNSNIGKPLLVVSTDPKRPRGRYFKTDNICCNIAWVMPTSLIVE